MRKLSVLFILLFVPFLVLGTDRDDSLSARKKIAGLENYSKWAVTMSLEKLKKYDSGKMTSYEAFWYRHSKPGSMIKKESPLPAGYGIEKLYSSPMPLVDTVEQSESGIIYVKHRKPAAALSIIDLEKGPLTPVIDLHDIPVSYKMVSGPGDTIFIKAHNEIRQIYPDGSFTLWCTIQEGGVDPLVYRGDHFIGRSNDWSEIVRIGRNGGVEKLYTGFNSIYDMEMDREGNIYLSDWKKGNIVRIDPRGNMKILVGDVMRDDPVELEISSSGRLYMGSIGKGGFVEVDRQTGRLTDMNRARRLTNVPFNFELIAGDGVIFVDATNGKIVWGSLKGDETGYLLKSRGISSPVIRVSPQGEVYIGDTEEEAIYRVEQGGLRKVYEGVQQGAFDFDRQGRLCYFISGKKGSLTLMRVDREGQNSPLTVAGGERFYLMRSLKDRDGFLLIAFPSKIYLLEGGKLRLVTERLRLPQEYNPVIWLDSLRTGELFGFAQERLENFDKDGQVQRWIFRLDPRQGGLEIINTFVLDSQSSTMGNMCGGNGEEIWFLEGYGESRILRFTPDGRMEQFAGILITDCAGITVDAQGALYFTSNSGIYKIRKE